MTRFFQTMFGTLAAIAIGWGIAWGGSAVWKLIPSVNLSGKASSMSALAAAVVPQPTDGTIISGMTRTVRYTADEEEDLVDETTQTLPVGADAKITAKAYLVKDLTTGAIAAEDDPDRLLPIASLTKLVTAVVARRLIPADARITITPAIMATYSDTADFRAGETFTASDLLYPLLLVSSNDAAEAYAESYGRPRFLAAMDAFVQSISAYRTTFADPSGLSPLNESTADDLATIVQWIRLNDPTVLETTALKSMSVRGHTWTNPTHFLSWSYYLAGKNGYTDEADGTGISLFELGPKKDVYVVIVLGSEDRDADVIKLLAKVK